MGDNAIHVDHRTDTPVDSQGTATRLTEAAGGAVRSGVEGDAVDGLTPRYVVSPADTEQVSAVLRVCHDEGLAVVPRGSGTKLGWGAPARRLDVLLDLQRLDRLVDHAAGDLVAVVGAGRRLEYLQDDLASAGQWLAVDPPRHGTVGGLVVTADSGPMRLSHGAIRDLVIGVTMVRADGVVAHSGGKVVKNVAGYDLGKLATGSFGTLGVVTQVAVRLHPRPEATAVVTVPVRSPSHAHDLVQQVVHSQLVPTACELDVPPGGGGGGASLVVRFDGIAAGVGARASAAVELLGAGAHRDDDLPQWWARDPGATGDLSLRVTHEIACVATVLESIDRVCGAHGVLAAVRGSVAVGTLTVALSASVDRAAVAAIVDELRGQAPRFGGSVVVRDADPETRRHLDVWGPVRGLEMMRRVKDRFDPTGVLAPGRFVGGI